MQSKLFNKKLQIFKTNNFTQKPTASRLQKQRNQQSMQLCRQERESW